MSSDRLSEAEHRSLLRLAQGGQQQQQRTDFDVLREHFRFAWREGEEDESTWGARMAKRYVSKLFKEYALADLSRCRAGQVGLRWRVEREVIEGKGQFICGGLGCDVRAGLGSWELPFTYREAGQVKTELVKVRLCPRCKGLLDRAQQARGKGGAASGGGGGGGKEVGVGRRRPRSPSPPPPPPPPSSSSSVAAAAKRAKDEGEGGSGAAAGGRGAERERSSTPGARPPSVGPGGKKGGKEEDASEALARRREAVVQRERERRGREMDDLVAEILGGGDGEEGEKGGKGAEEG